jgi:hypothetical protein
LLTSNGAIAWRGHTDGINGILNAYDGYAWIGSVTNHPLNIITNNTPRIVVDSNGGVLIPAGGTSTPSSSVSSGALRIGGYETITNQSLGVFGGIRGLLLLGGNFTPSAGVDCGAIKFLYGPRSTTDENAAQIAQIAALTTANNNTSGGYLTFYTRPTGGTVTERMRVESSGELNMLSGQIKFPATQSASSDANTLDDYEEGSWTPRIDSNNGQGTFTTRSGWYVKIGRRVTAWFVVDGGSSLAAGTTQYVTGLPFSVFSSYSSTHCIGQMGTNGPTIRTQQLMTLSANRGVAYVYSGGNQETTTITFATGVLEYLTDS